MKNKSIISIVAFITFIVVIALISGIIVHKKESEIKKLYSTNLNLETNISDRDSLVNDLFASLNEIENNLTQIKLKRSQLEIIQDEATVSQKELILNDIKQLDTMLEKNNKKIKGLENKIYKSGLKITSLNRKIESLNKDSENQNKEISKFKQKIEENELVIVELNTKVDNLASEIETKNQHLEEKSEIINQQVKELNKAYLAYGTFKELKENGLVKKEGSVLGIGGEKTLEADIDNDNYIKLDIREISKIPLYSKKAHFITEHPDSSYHFIEADGLITYLEIEEPEEFWKISKYAVIETK